jgi:acyl-CoA thioester hydrolase
MKTSILTSVPIRVYYEDTDMAGVVYYANYLKFFERARTEWLRTLGIENRAILQSNATAFVVTDITVKYLMPAKMDDLLEATVDSVAATRASAVLMQTIFRGNLVLCTAVVKIASVSVATGKPVRLPADLARQP